MAHNDFMQVTDDKPKKSVKKQIIWTTVITLILGFFAFLEIICYNHHYKIDNYEIINGVTLMLVSIGCIFFMTLFILLMNSIEWQEPEKCKKTLHYFYLAILVLSIVGLVSGITALIV
jgi:Sec-independent protein secretion pathway component TatC